MEESSIKSRTAPKVLVCQRGARHRYAIPRLFEEAGLLTGLNTDSTVYSPAGMIAQGMGRLGVKSPRVRALSSRKPQGVPRQKIFSSDQPFMASFLRGVVSPSLGPTYMKWGLRGAKVVYNMYGEDIEFLQWAKGQGARIVADVFVHPGTNRIVAEEMVRYIPGSSINLPDIEHEAEHSRTTFRLADILLCPSEWVADGVREFSPECAGKIRIVPYGSSIVPAQCTNTPVPGRILFAGRDALRKGLHHLAEAAHLVRERGGELDVVVAGIDKSNLGWLEHRAELNCLGTIPMHQMHEEFLQADAMVLPSLSEGQAGVILEAMSCGCPVIATKESGVDFKPDCGVIVPVGDTVALAHAIGEVVGNRERRNQLAQGALQQAREFSMEEWKRRLVDVVNEVGT